MFPYSMCPVLVPHARTKWVRFPLCFSKFMCKHAFMKQGINSWLQYFFQASGQARRARTTSTCEKRLREGQ